jgi:hypothetical protein
VHIVTSDDLHEAMQQYPDAANEIKAWVGIVKGGSMAQFLGGSRMPTIRTDTQFSTFGRMKLLSVVTSFGKIEFGRRFLSAVALLVSCEWPFARFFGAAERPKWRPAPWKNTTARTCCAAIAAATVLKRRAVRTVFGSGRVFQGAVPRQGSPRRWPRPT